MPLILIRLFIEYGLFGPVRLGMVKQEVLRSLGKPDFKGKGALKFSIFHYGDFEFHFNSNVLWLIQNDHILHRALHAGNHISLEPFGIRRAMPLSRLTKHLDTYGIAYQDIDLGYTDPKPKMLAAGAGINLLFNNQKLACISYSLPSNEADHKDLLIKLPARVLKALDDEANRKHIAIGDLCGNWIKERARELP